MAHTHLWYATATAPTSGSTKQTAVSAGTAAHKPTVSAISDLATTAPRAKQHVTLAPKASTAQTQIQIQKIVVAAELHVLRINVLLASVVL